MSSNQDLILNSIPEQIRPNFNFKFKIFYVHIPKCGGNTIKSSIEGFEGDSHFGIKYFRDLQEQLGLSGFKCAAFVRNPWDRAYSAYNYLSAGGLTDYDLKSKEEYLSKFMDFEDFVMNGGIDTAALHQLHFLPQYKFLDDKMDFIGKLEHINTDFFYLCSLIGKTSAFMKNSNIAKKVSRSSVFTSKMIEKIYEIYRIDANVLGYGFQKNIFMPSRQYPHLKTYV